LSAQQQQGQAGQKPPTLFQFICVACGIKFTSLDNLTAHQAYYCPKRSELIAKTAAEAVGDKNSLSSSRKCVKCKVSSLHCVGGFVTLQLRLFNHTVYILRVSFVEFITGVSPKFFTSGEREADPEAIRNLCLIFKNYVTKIMS
jgi:hypothetical protein